MKNCATFAGAWFKIKFKIKKTVNTWGQLLQTVCSPADGYIYIGWPSGKGSRGLGGDNILEAKTFSKNRSGAI